MDILELAAKIVEQQGILALLLLIVILQNYVDRKESCKERKELLSKNCELNRFIMMCLKQKIDEDSVLHLSSTTKSSQVLANDTGVKGTITPTTPQPSANGL